MAPDSPVERYIQNEWYAYRDLARVSGKNAEKLGTKYRTWLRRTRTLTDWLEGQGVVVPAEHLQAYDVPPADRMAAGLPIKYQFRAYNILRDLARVQAACPELIDGSALSKDVLDLSSGGCGLYEALSYLGHRVTCRDYFPRVGTKTHGNAYALIHSLLDLDVHHFDGTIRPFDFAPASQDYVFCFQAIDAYAPSDEWLVVTEELLQVARQTVVVVLNPPAEGGDLDVDVDKLISSLSSKPLEIRRFACVDTHLPGFRLDKTR